MLRRIGNATKGQKYWVLIENRPIEIVYKDYLLDAHTIIGIKYYLACDIEPVNIKKLISYDILLADTKEELINYSLSQTINQMKNLLRVAELLIS